MNDIASPPILIGTVHRDPQGEERLLGLLESVKPEVVTLEMSPYACDYRRNHGRAQLLRLERIIERLSRETGRDAAQIAAHPAVAGIRDLLDLPFEYRASSRYAEAKHIPLHLIDLSEISAMKLRRVENELITYRNLKILTSLPEEESPASQEGYATAQVLVFASKRSEARQAYLERRRGAEGVGPRDARMAEEIRKRVEDFHGRKVAHVGGWVHLLEDEKGETLYSRLEDLHPLRVLLDEQRPDLH